MTLALIGYATPGTVVAIALLPTITGLERLIERHHSDRSVSIEREGVFDPRREARRPFLSDLHPDETREAAYRSGSGVISCT